MAEEKTPIPHLKELARENLEKLRANPYPGRGIILGHNESGSLAVQIYFITGRSPGSRNRKLVYEGSGIKTDYLDKSKDAGDTSLTLYNAMRQSNYFHIVSNGDQTDTVIDALKTGWGFSAFHDALKTRTFEPDPPSTPRISGISTIVPLSDFIAIHDLSIIRKGKNEEPEHDFFSVSNLKGIGDCIHTYETDGNPLPSFEGNPYPVPIPETIDEIVQAYWDVLNADNKVTLVVKTLDRKGKADYRIINKNQTPSTK